MRIWTKTIGIAELVSFKSNDGFVIVLNRIWSDNRQEWVRGRCSLVLPAQAWSPQRPDSFQCTGIVDAMNLAAQMDQAVDTVADLYHDYLDKKETGP